MLPKTEKRVDTQVVSSTEKVIEVQTLSKSYGETRAIENVSFSVGRGEIFGYLGPNGAGKTTTVNIFCGLLERDAGEVMICGLNIKRDPIDVKQRIGVVPEESNLYPELTCRRNLEYLAELYGLPRPVRRKKVEELLELFSLGDKRAVLFRALSRGMKRRLTVAAALLHSPEVVFLDEPTAGLDVPSARALRSLIKAINREGTTVFLTTHNLVEAETLCHRVLILVKGRVVTEGTAAQIRQRVEKARTVSLRLSGDIDERRLREACPAVRSASIVDNTWRLEITDPHAAVAQILSFAEQQGIRLLDIETSTTSLEDAFMTILQDNGERQGGDP
jgi:ABC-2 type transport system ATP-binding protein